MIKEIDNEPALVGEIWCELITARNTKRIYLHYAKGPYLLDRVVTDAHHYLGSFNNLDPPKTKEGNIDLEAFKNEIAKRVRFLLRKHHEGARIPSSLGKWAHQWQDHENPPVG